MLSRRAFLRACMYTAPVALLVPEVARTIILPPVGGWGAQRPLTLEEMVKRAVRARAGRLAENIAMNNALLTRLRLRGVLDRRAAMAADEFAATGHMLDIARDEEAIATYLIEGLPLAVDGVVLNVPNPYTGMQGIASVAPTIEMPADYRVGGVMREEFPKLPTRRGEFRDHLVSPDRWYELNAGHNG